MYICFLPPHLITLFAPKSLSAGGQALKEADSYVITM